MQPRSHRRDLVETLLGNRGNLISLSKIADILQTDRKRIKERLRYLIDKGAVSVTKRHKSPRQFNKPGPDAQEIIYSINRQKLWELLRKPIRKSYSKWDAMWRVVRAYKRFTRNDLCQLAGANIGNVRNFTKALRKAGYIREARGVWELTVDAGPERPIPSAK